MASVLYVEDEENLRGAIGYALRKDGHEVYFASGGHEALGAFQQHQPELVLLDVMLPGLDGFAVLRRIRELANVPVIVLTARSEEVDTVVGLELGADDYIGKACRMRELMARVNAALRRAGLTAASAGAPATPAPQLCQATPAQATCRALFRTTPPAQGKLALTRRSAPTPQAGPAARGGSPRSRGRRPQQGHPAGTRSP